MSTLTHARKLAGAGQLEQACQILLRIITETDGVEAAQALELLGRCRVGLFQTAEAVAAFDEACEKYRDAGESEAAQYCELQQTRLDLDQRRLRPVTQLVQDSLHAARTHNWTDLQSLATEFEGLVHFHSKNHASALVCFEQALELGDGRKLPWEVQQLKLTLASCYVALGQTARGVALIAGAESDPSVAAVPRASATLLMNQAYAAWVARDYPAARQGFERMILLFETKGGDRASLGWIHSMALYNLGLVELQEGSYLQARKQLMRAWQMTRELGHNQLVCASLNALCLVSLLEGKVDDALHYAEVCSSSVMEFGDIESMLTAYYLALGYLATEQLAQADRSWAAKPELPVNQDTRVEFERILMILDRMSEPDYRAGRLPVPDILQRIQQWKLELHRSFQVPPAPA